VEVSPTPIEIVSIDDPGKDADPRAVLTLLPEVARAQGDRPTRVHATDIAVADIEEVLERCRRDGRRHWTMEDQLGIKRVWMGFDTGAPTDYRPDGDGGLHFEFLPTRALRLPAAAFTAQRHSPSNGDGAFVGLAARTYLVENLDHVLLDIAQAFDWEPDHPVEIAPDGSRRARLAFAIATSPELLLIEPRGRSEDAESLRRWGPGPWSITIRVDGLDTRAEELRRRGTQFREVVGSFSTPRRTLRIDATQTPGCLFDLIDANDD
jgi:hypothetical protein